MNSSNYYLHAILLNNCPYSNSADQLLKNFKIPCQITRVDNNNKNNFKTNLISTFPQIFLKKYNNKGTLLLGGYSDLESFVNDFKSIKYDEKKVNEFMKKYGWAKKATLRLIQLINQ
jgi:glutaredoxin